MIAKCNARYQKAYKMGFYLTRRRADIVMTVEPTTNNASADLARVVESSTRCLGTLSPKKTTCKSQSSNQQYELEGKNAHEGTEYTIYTMHCKTKTSCSITIFVPRKQV
jgi:hypothetical protein